MVEADSSDREHAESVRLDDAQRREAARAAHVRSRAAHRGHGTRVADRGLADELEARGVTFRPHYWLSDEWFTPDGVPGVAIPFYLAHPRLAKLELAQMLEVEGGDATSCLRILRHEVGHAIDNAYELQAASDAATSLRKSRDALSRVLHAEALQQELRAASRPLVRAEPSRRRLRRDVRRLARSAVEMGDRGTRLACAAEAGIHGSADARAGAPAARRHGRNAQVDPLPRLRKTLARALSEEA